MKSNICKIDNSTKDLEAILKESEKVAVYNELDRKQTLQLRLLCEEIDGMLPNIVDRFNGELWIEFEGGECRVNVALRFDEFSAEKKADLIKLAKNKKNAAAAGVVGKIRSALENFFLEPDNFGGGDMSLESRYFVTKYCDPMEYACVWSLGSYVNSVKKEKKTEEWDELERSVIASVADDVIVGVKGTRADIIIVKKFA